MLQRPILSIDAQLERGWLACPSSLTSLRREGDRLRGGVRDYPLHAGKPVFLPQPARVRDVHRAGAAPSRRLSRVIAGLGLDDDGRSDRSRTAYRRLLEAVGPTDLAVDVGGGPSPAPPGFLNLNIFLDDAVDVVASATSMPWLDGIATAVSCEAVLEHLRDPAAAVREMRRILRPGGLAFAVTPFMQGFHGSPNHFQNFTLAGHRALFEDAGFIVEDAGVCVGPLHALGAQVAVHIGDVTGSRWLRRAGLLGSRALGRVDRALADRPWAANLCSTTYVLARRA